MPINNENHNKTYFISFDFSKDVHCWTLVFPKVLHNNRSCAVSSDYLTTLCNNQNS